MLVLAGSILALILLTESGCGSREAEFLKKDMQSETAASEDDAESEEKSSEHGKQTEKELTGDSPQTDVEPAGGSRQNEPEPSGSGMQNEPEFSGDGVQPKASIYVDVCGAVASPGVYELEAESRVFQAIDAAGGLLADAAGEYVNRAGYLEDGQQIYIPTREEAENHPSLLSPLEQNLSAGNTGSSSSDTGSSEASGKINLNTADEAALTTLTGIGASKAQAILAYREEHGGFSAIEEILNVPGIKEGTFVKIKDNIAVE